MQMNGIEWSPGSLEPAESVDATLEYYPNMYNGGQTEISKTITTKRYSKTHYFGAHTGWNNFPRHLTDGLHILQIMHPSV